MKIFPFRFTFGALVAYFLIANYAWLFRHYSLIPNALGPVLGAMLADVIICLWGKKRRKNEIVKD